MKKLSIVLLIFSGTYCLSASAQNCIPDYLGTKTLYKIPAVKYTPAPAGYLPVFINHVGRHGARHLTKEVNTSYAYTVLSKADSAKALTEKGQKLWQMIVALDKVEKGNVKSISAEGRSELNGIGERMYAHYSNVFKDKANLNVAITKEVRTRQSAEAFLGGLKNKLKKEAVIKEYTDDTNLRFYDVAPAYKQFEEDGEWVKYLSALEKAEHIDQISKAIVQRVFKPGFAKTWSDAATEKFAGDIFGFATISFSLKEEVIQAGFQPADVAFSSFFTCDEIKVLSRLDVADDYLKKGPGINANGIQVRIAVPLLINFLNTTDDFIKTGNINAQLRFAHAETIAPFAALLGITIANRSTTNANAIGGPVWQASQVVPLSSNIQWVFYKNTTNKYLVKVLLNEKEVHIAGLSNTGFPYYNWKDLKQLYANKLHRLNVKMDDDMEAYLQNIH